MLERSKLDFNDMSITKNHNYSEFFFFFEKDKLTMNNPSNDAIIVNELIANYQVGNILIDMGSSINTIFKSVFDKLGLVNFKLAFTRRPLYNFVKEWRENEG